MRVELTWCGFLLTVVASGAGPLAAQAKPTELVKTELVKTELAKTELAKTELAKTELPNTELPKGMTRLAGTDRESATAYTLISVDGRLTSTVAPLPPKAPPPALPTPPQPLPRLTAQCTRAGDKLKFELLVDLGGGPELVFLAPWRPGHGTLFEPPIRRTVATMEFLGYVKEKPVKRQFDLLEGAMAGVMRYSTPGMNTANLEPIAFYMQYLKALPTFRLTVPGQGIVEFETLPWQSVVRAEPLCRMASL